MTITATYATGFQLPHDKYPEKRKSVVECFLRKIDICTNLMYIYYITAKLEIFSTDMLWESCSKFNLEQLSHSMSVANIVSLAVARETCDP